MSKDDSPAGFGNSTHLMLNWEDISAQCLTGRDFKLLTFLVLKDVVNVI